MVGCSELPRSAVEQILRIARGRCIAGTNAYARVCQQWCETSTEAEPLHLFVNLSHLSEEDLARATSWLSTHGQHVETLVIHRRYTCQLHWDLRAASSLRQLKRLEVSPLGALGELAPVLRQMPQLQHLAVGLDVGMCPRSGWADTSAVYWPYREPHGMFLVSAQHPQGQVPDMQELCPQLTSLVLTVWPQASGCRIDPAVSRLFNPGLQQLTLAESCNSNFGPVLCASSLVHLSALQQLKLDGVLLDEQGATEVAQGLGALQQVHVHSRPSIQRDDAHLVHLAGKLVNYEVFVEDQHVNMLASFGNLTRLVLHGDLPEGTAGALAALTGLQQLGLRWGSSSSTVDVVRQAAGWAQLRSLELFGFGTPQCNAEMASCVVGCTQLTSLVMLVGVRHEPHLSAPWVSLLQQLTGLRCLTVYQQHIAWEQGSWLVPLTALTCLCVNLHQDVPLSRSLAAQFCHLGVANEPDGVWYRFRQVYQNTAQQLMTGLQEWPAQLQQIMFCVEHVVYYYKGFAPVCWQYTPSAPGSAHVNVWLEYLDESAAGWARPFRPCPHLPRVWELQGPADRF